MTKTEKQLADTVLELGAEAYVNKLMNQIIDDLHPNFKPVSDEMLSDDGIYSKIYLNKSLGKKQLVSWEVRGDTPETVKTVFHRVREVDE